MEGNLTEILLL